MCPNHFKTSVPTPPASPLMGAITKPHTRQSLKREFITDLISQDKWLPKYTLHPGSPGKREALEDHLFARSGDEHPKSLSAHNYIPLAKTCPPLGQ